YVVVGVGGAMLFAIAVGYGLAKYKFSGRRAVFVVLLGAVAVFGMVLAVSMFLMFFKFGLTNIVWAIIILFLVSLFGLYLMWVYATDVILVELFEAVWIDGAGEVWMFFIVALRFFVFGIVTMLLFAMVSIWNNYFLSLIMLSKPNLYPLTVKLTQ